MSNPFLTRRTVLQGIAACTGLTAVPGMSWSADGKVLNIRSNRDIQVLDPASMIGGTEIDLQVACLASLAVFKPGDEIAWQPSDFVESIEQTDPTHIKFVLRPGIMWSGDNGELTAEDVKYSYERIANPENKFPWKDKWGSLQGVKVNGKYEGVIELKQSFAPLWLTTLCDGTGTIVCKAATEKVGGKFTTEFPAQCGPYLMKEWLPKQHVVLVRNPQWNGPKPSIEEVRILFINEETTGELAFEAGEVDLTDVSLASSDRYRKQLPPQTKLYERPGLWWTWMGMNTDHPKLSDIRVRKAIQYAVDVRSILEAAYGGVGPLSHGVVPPGLIGHRKSGAFDKQDIEKAKALLAEAGVSDLTLNIKVLNQTANLTAAQIIQANLADAGITLDITPMDAGPFWNLGIEEKGDEWKDLQLWIMRFGDTPDPSQMTQWYVSDQVGVWNWERWKNPEFDELHKKGLVESDPKVRDEIYLRMQQIMEDTGAYVWITHEPYLAIYRDTIEPVILPGPRPYFPWFKWV